MPNALPIFQELCIAALTFNYCSGDLFAGTGPVWSLPPFYARSSAAAQTRDRIRVRWASTSARPTPLLSAKLNFEIVDQTRRAELHGKHEKHSAAKEFERL